MFDVLVESTSQRRGALTWVYFAAASAVWLFVFATIAVAGIMTYDGRLDAEFENLNLVAWSPAAAPPPKLETRPVAAHDATVQPGLHSVTEVPREISLPHPAPPSLGTAVPGAVEGGDPYGQVGGEFGAGGDVVGGVPPSAVARVAPPPQPPVEPQSEARTPPAVPKRPVSRVLSGIATRRVEPRYPDMAIKTGVSGNVVVEVTVSEQGEVISANVLSGHPLLRTAALDAARQWRFTPTLLGGTPVKVIGTITFAFKR